MHPHWVFKQYKLIDSEEKVDLKARVFEEKVESGRSREHASIFGIVTT